MEELIEIRMIDWNSVDGFAARRIRFNVFVDEQRVPSNLELDETDLTAVHMLAVLSDGTSCGTGRIFTDSRDHRAAHIGRMAVLKESRGRGCGSALLDALIDHARKQGYAKVELSAQCHATGFYEKHGFVSVGDEYLDAGIPHRKMEMILSGKSDCI